jgi:hypothetical protein
MLLKALNLHDDYLLENPTTNPVRRVYTCCILLLILLTKRTLRHMTIKLDTAKRYVAAYASLCALAQDIDIRKDLQTDTVAGLPFRLLCADQKRWEEDPKRKEPWSVDMQKNLDAWCRDNLEPEDSHASAMSDWFCVGCYTGHRKSEWAQPEDAYSAPADFLREDDATNMPRAFTFSDISFHTSRRKPLTTNQVLALPEHAAMRLIGQMSIRWRTQKNGRRNQLIFFTPNTQSPGLCCIRRMLRILRRFKRLSGGNSNLPLSLFQSAEGQTFNTTTKHIESVMRATVARWANLDPANAIHAKVLQQWSSHSLRVGATNILYANGFTDHQIQTILRWESLAFMTYFRNLSIVSDKQNNAIFLEDEMVNLF